MELTINTTITFDSLIQSKSRVSQHIGGTRSGKTYAILQYLIVKAIEENVIVTIVRKSIPVVKRSVMKDFIDILKSLNIWNEENFNISDRTWTYNNSIIQFVSTDDAAKLRGIKSSILFIDEASEVDEESYFQLSIRTTNKIILAFNPTISPYHWLRQMDDCDRFVTTYKDNPYIPKEMVRAIEELEIKSPKKWLIYGKGEYAPNDKAIFEFDIVNDFDGEFVAAGMDFGFSSDPNAIVYVYKNGNDIILEEKLYEKGMVTNDIINHLQSLNLGRNEIWCDSAEPRLIEEIYRAGFNAKPVTKGKDSIRFGIQTLQNYNIKIYKPSQNLINEMYAYQWATDKYGYTTDTPEGGLDHLIDAARYVAMMRLTRKNEKRGQYAISIR